MAVKFIVVVLSLAVSSSLAVNWDDFRVKYSPIHIEGQNFYQVPRTEEDAVSQKWERTDETKDDTTSNYKVYCLDRDPSSCVLYDNMGTICGYQMSIPEEVAPLAADMGIDYEKVGWKKNTVNGNKVFSTIMYFESPDTIAKGGRAFDGQTGHGLWLQIGDELVEIPTHESEVAEKLKDFIPQNCFDKMGKHYFYGARKDLTAEEYRNWFLLFADDGELQGLGSVTFGSNFEKSNFFSKAWKFASKLVRGVHEWFEFLPAAAVKKIAPDFPDWVSGNITKQGPLSQHLYFKSKPWNVKCKE